MVKEHALVSIIIPVYKTEQFLARCINSVLRQTYTHLEIILIDDGSPDKCPQMCDSFAEEDARIRVVHKSNEGVSVARNVGLGMACGEYISFLDSDDYLHPDFIRRMMEIMDETNTMVVQCRFEAGRLDGFSPQKEKANVKVFSDSTMFGNRAIKIIVCAKLYKAAVLSGITFPEGKRYEDEFFTYKALYYGKSVAITNERLYYYYNNDQSFMRTDKEILPMEFVEAFEERIRFFEEEKDFVAAELSRKEFAIRLMLFYIRCYKNKGNMNNKEKILSDFRKLYRSIANVQGICIKERTILTFFNCFPKFTAKTVVGLGLI